MMTWKQRIARDEDAGDHSKYLAVLYGPENEELDLKPVSAATIEAMLKKPLAELLGSGGDNPGLVGP